ncbi:hypothetical protein JXZ92_01675 [Mycoplasma sp. CSL10137]|uniref:hypothetical protein n=1 Tax=unclassified Mycoplasma TaxID=2683645 RepID=UPI00197B5E47|nr:MULTISPECIES: hypothetical protein [unclassified Mycoplasma]MBN4083530.1 hypothetical protein [Mycoplasma sp. CSL10137]MBN4084540.1 hypothetical protein [Mycoplasma sp. CSL10166]MBU4693018.1 hypothetical protein [Mycoplasma sp. CSL7491-lung]
MKFDKLIDIIGTQKAINNNTKNNSKNGVRNKIKNIPKILIFLPLVSKINVEISHIKKYIKILFKNVFLILVLINKKLIIKDNQKPNSNLLLLLKDKQMTTTHII